AKYIRVGARRYCRRRQPSVRRGGEWECKGVFVLDPDPVTLISKLDINDPLHLHPNDTNALTVVSIKLKGTENYQAWSCAMLLALEGKNKSVLIDGTCKKSNTDEFLGRQWDNVNAIVLGWILNSISEEFFLGLDDYYMQIRSSILSREVLPDVISAHATISSEKSRRVAAGSIVGSSQRNHAFAFVFNVPNRNNFQRNNQNRDWHYRLGHPAKPVLNVLKGSLQIDNMDKNVYCETFQRAKQTREPFPFIGSI
nr:ribonuclease H-like domain-containing protein [Tanacetum cinerariifolium]